jgi:predicted HAD superfamily phosphohydrolase YqeG
MVMIGNRLYEDITFGNLNQMATVYVTNLNKITAYEYEPTEFMNIEKNFEKGLLETGP